MSKGDKQRPTDYTKYSENYDRIFGSRRKSQYTVVSGPYGFPTKAYKVFDDEKDHKEFVEKLKQEPPLPAS